MTPPTTSSQLISYIAPSAPATWRPATGDEPFLRPEIGFTPKWYHTELGIDLGERWHTDPEYRRETVLSMRDELARRFGRVEPFDDSPDLLTGTFGICTVGGVYGLPIRYAADGSPACEHEYLSDEAAEKLTPPDLDDNPFFGRLMEQLDWIAAHEGRIEGYVNWQGVLNNAERLRGEALFIDMIENPRRARRVFDCVCTTMIDAARRLHARQRETGVEVGFFTVSNCLVNMISPQQYAEGLLEFDRRIAEAFGCIGIHNCAWCADPYVESYARVPHVAYIDMGLDSDLARAKELFPDARRALMYTTMDLANKPLGQMRADMESAARDYGPCDVVLAGIEAGTPDQRMRNVIEICREISQDRPST